MTNQEKSDHIRKMLDEYTDCNDDETDVVDILADIMHFCKINDVDLHYCNHVAHVHYTEELREEQ